MSDKKGQEELNVGDRVMVYFLEKETFRPGTKGTVMGITQDPTEADNLIVKMKWDNGSTLNILTKYDRWKIIDKEKIDESRPDKFYRENPEIFKNFDYRFLRNYLEKIRESGIINMFGAAPLLYAGAEHIDRYYGENPPNEEAFQEVLEMANDSKDKMIQGTVKCLEEKGKPIELESVQREIKNYSEKVWKFFVAFH
jgi:hypothetical protein